ncbi:membrane traffic protein [Lithospermum erythrorhizon]|uniref:Exocyst subunit Exo70 family protein n=1 Tax=Lithospermum erythrorhizon TaxID=34254 RepID=A0AAV3QR70_LITER
MEICSILDEAKGNNGVTEKLEGDCWVERKRPKNLNYQHYASQRNETPQDCNSTSWELSIMKSNPDGVNSQVQEDVHASVVNSLSDGELRLELVHPAAISELKKIADRMIRSGTEKVQKIGKWIPILKIVIKLLLIEEIFLCEKVFAGSKLMREFDAVEICKRSSEKLLLILDTYDALLYVMPDLEELFNGDSGAGEMVCSEAKGVLDGFCEATTATFVEFEIAVREEASTSRKLKNGDIHPFTQYVMNCVKLLVDYSEILNGVFEKTDYDENDEVENVERMPCITRRLLSLIKSLESNLQEKYEDGGLQSVFLMNNLLHIINKVKDSEVRNFLGDHCISEWRGQIRQYAASYLRAVYSQSGGMISQDAFMFLLGSNVLCYDQHH